MRQGLSLKIFVLLICWLATIPVVWAGSSEWRLDIKPQKCVALRQGHVCYQKIIINWIAPVKGNYCLYISNNKRAIRCWDNASNGRLKFEFQGKKSETIFLSKKGGRSSLTKNVVEVKWVYRSKRSSRTGWRVF